MHVSLLQGGTTHGPRCAKNSPRRKSESHYEAIARSVLETVSSIEHEKCIVTADSGDDADDLSDGARRNGGRSQGAGRSGKRKQQPREKSVQLEQPSLERKGQTTTTSRMVVKPMPVKQCLAVATVQGAQHDLGDAGGAETQRRQHDHDDHQRRWHANPAYNDTPASSYASYQYNQQWRKELQQMQIQHRQQQPHNCMQPVHYPPYHHSAHQKPQQHQDASQQQPYYPGPQSAPWQHSQSPPQHQQQHPPTPYHDYPKKQLPYAYPQQQHNHHQHFEQQHAEARAHFWGNTWDPAAMDKRRHDPHYQQHLYREEGPPPPSSSLYDDDRDDLGRSHRWAAHGLTHGGPKDTAASAGL